MDHLNAIVDSGLVIVGLLGGWLAARRSPAFREAVKEQFGVRLPSKPSRSFPKIPARLQEVASRPPQAASPTNGATRQQDRALVVAVRELVSAELASNSRS